jgi:hypothetical protein
VQKVQNTKFGFHNQVKKVQNKPLIPGLNLDRNMLLVSLRQCLG